MRERLARARRRVARRVRKLRWAYERPRDAEVVGISPENLVWIFGSARTGSTWLGAMMADLEDHDW